MAGRRVEVLRDGEWVGAKMESIRRGDSFRMFDPGGKPVVGQGRLAGCTVFKAGDNAHKIDGVWGCKCKRGRGLNNAERLGRVFGRFGKKG